MFLLTVSIIGVFVEGEIYSLCEEEVELDAIVAGQGKCALGSCQG